MGAHTKLALVILHLQKSFGIPVKKFNF